MTIKTISPLFMRGLFLFLFFCSCSSSNFFFDKKKLKNDFGFNKESDFLKHLENLASFYIDSNEAKIIPLSSSQKKYLEKIYWKIINNNKEILNKKLKPKFHLIKEERPFLFSLPKGHFFISSKIFDYILNGDTLAAALSYQIFQSHYNLYKKTKLIPLGFLSTDKIISITRLPVNLKPDLHKRAYLIMKKAGFNSAMYLNWIRIQNRHHKDFILHLGSNKSISKEESILRKFIINRHPQKTVSLKKEKNQMKDFSLFRKSLKEWF